MANKHKLKKHYNSFNRYILAELLSEKALNEIDKIYTEARIQRTIKNLIKQTQ